MDFRVQPALRYSRLKSPELTPSFHDYLVLLKFLCFLCRCLTLFLHPRGIGWVLFIIIFEILGILRRQSLALAGFEMLGENHLSFAVLARD
jgi:hypothetical protein